MKPKLWNCDKLYSFEPNKKKTSKKSYVNIQENSFFVILPQNYKNKKMILSILYMFIYINTISIRFETKKIALEIYLYLDVNS